jgi:uracil-DNA glycosylase
MSNLKVILSLGLVSHNAVMRLFDEKLSAHKFGHGVVHNIQQFKLIDSYHCSRYNTQTKRLTMQMFEDVFKIVRAQLEV